MKIHNIFNMSNILTSHYEYNFQHYQAVKFVNDNYSIPLLSIFLYGIFCYFVPNIMNSYNAFDLKYHLSIWNGFLAIFSLIGTIKTLPFLFLDTLSCSYENSICTDPVYTWADSTTGFWVMLFIFSKIPELFDTVFIVLRKRKLIFLHWYHHITVLIYCWDAYAKLVGTGLYFVSMNYFVHTIMYSYYCAKSLEICPKNFPNYIITILQTIQMLVGTILCLSSWYYMYSREKCHNDINNLIYCSIMYSSYLYLFYSFGIKRFIKKKNK